MSARLALAAILAMASPAVANAAVDEALPALPQADPSLPQAAIVGDAELAEQRGGFRVGSLDIQLGADIRSYIGGQIVMQTTLSWTDVATSAQHIFSPEGSPALLDSLATGLKSGAAMSLNLGGQTATFANGGRTAFVQRTDGTIQNIIVNTASNVDLRQEVDIKLDIGGFTPFRNDVVAARIGSALSSMSRLALLMRGPN